MTELTVPRKQVMLSFLSDEVLKIKADDDVFRIDSAAAVEGMLNGDACYELTTATITFTGTVSMDSPEVKSRLKRKT